MGLSEKRKEKKESCKFDSIAYQGQKFSQEEAPTASTATVVELQQTGRHSDCFLA